MQLAYTVSTTVAVLVVSVLFRRRVALVRNLLYEWHEVDESIATHPDRVFVDEFLARWSRFSEGERALLSSLRVDVPRFAHDLLYLLREDPSWALGRAIFFPIVQMGGFVPVDCPMGRAMCEAMGKSRPMPRLIGGGPALAAADLYDWWERHRHDFAPMPLYDRWRASALARELAIPMYQRTLARPRYVLLRPEPHESRDVAVRSSVVEKFFTLARHRPRAPMRALTSRSEADASGDERLPQSTS